MLEKSSLIDDHYYWIRWTATYMHRCHGVTTDTIKTVHTEPARYDCMGVGSWWLCGSDVLFGPWDPDFASVEVLCEIVQPQD